MFGVRWRTVSAFSCLLVACGPGKPKEPRPEPVPEPPETPIVGDRDLRRDPPAVQSMEAMLLDKDTPRGNALLMVRFVEKEKLPPTLTIDTEDRRVLLRDDGKDGDEKAQDGVFSAIFRLDVARLAARQKELADLGREPIKIPQFDGRQLKQELPLAPFDINKITPRQRFPFPPPLPAVLPGDVSIDHSLAITHTVADPSLGGSVVDDPTRTFNPCTGVGNDQGKWTFGHLMTEMANTPVTGLDPRVFTRRWLEKWMTDQTVNTFTVEQRTAIQSLVITPWETASGVGPGGLLDLKKAPFRLLAIINRVDLSDNLVYGQGSAGEARFVFGVLGPAPSCSPARFAVIFEYGVEAKGCKGLKAWAKQWFDLKQHAIGTPAYNAALEAITEQFVNANAAPTKPNGSALNQLRTNENALNPLWELREFRIDLLEGGHLREVTVKQNPDQRFHQSGTLPDTTTDFVNTNEVAVLADAHVVTLDFPMGKAYLGGASPTPGGVFWNDDGAPTITNRDARHHFSLNTCNGCHAGETQTPFLHVGVRTFGSPAGLSGFMTGITVADPADGAPNRTFNDLLRRQQRTADILSNSCFAFLPFSKLKMVH